MAQQAPEPPPVLVLPCRVSRQGDPSGWGLSRGQVERWQVVFPALDVVGEARKAEAWLHANPGPFAANASERELTARYGVPLVSRLLADAEVPSLRGMDYRRPYEEAV